VITTYNTKAQQMKYISYFLITFASFFSPIYGLILTLLGFVLADTIMGIYTTIKLHGIESFKSTKLFNIVVKTFFYVTSVMCMFAVDQFILEGQMGGIKHVLSKAFCVLFIYIEIKSIDESSMKLGNRSVWSIVKEIMNRIQSFKKDIKS
jgi:hypothetical protein